MAYGSNFYPFVDSAVCNRSILAFLETLRPGHNGKNAPPARVEYLWQDGRLTARKFRAIKFFLSCFPVLPYVSPFLTCRVYYRQNQLRNSRIFWEKDKILVRHDYYKSYGYKNG